MRGVIDLSLSRRRTRREALALLGASAVALAIPPAFAATTGGEDKVLTESAVLRDPVAVHEAIVREAETSDHSVEASAA